jgi:hypothetical protein
LKILFNNSGILRIGRVRRRKRRNRVREKNGQNKDVKRDQVPYHHLLRKEKLNINGTIRI